MKYTITQTRAREKKTEYHFLTETGKLAVIIATSKTAAVEALHWLHGDKPQATTQRPRLPSDAHRA